MQNDLLYQSYDICVGWIQFIQDKRDIIYTRRIFKFNFSKIGQR